MRYILSNQETIELRGKEEKVIVPTQILVAAGSGHGKTLLLERAIYNYLMNNFNVICITDQKDLLELAFMGMPTEIIADYQLKALKNQNLEPMSAAIEIFHPFTFDIPTKKIPEFRFFTLPITEIGDSEIRFLIEDTEDKTTREVLLSALEKLDKKSSLWNLMFIVQGLIERDVDSDGNIKKKMPDRERFGLSSTSSGTIKNIDEISRIFDRFQKHMFLMPEDHKFNLNIVQELFYNQKKIKIFSTKYIKGQKTKDFLTLMILNQIIANVGKSKYPILIVLDEIKDLVPSDTRNIGYKNVLASVISKLLNTSFRANDISSVSASQSLGGINKTLLKQNAFTHTFMGALHGKQDLETLRNVYGFDNETIHVIDNSLGYSQFLVGGISNLSIKSQLDDKPFKSRLSPFPHKEPSYKFDEFYKQYFPNNFKNYSDLLNDMKAVRSKYKDWAVQENLKKIREKKKQEDELDKDKNELKELKEKVTEAKQEKKSSRKDMIKQRNEQIFESKDKMTQREIAEKFNISQPRVNEILTEMEKEKESKNYEEEHIKDLSEENKKEESPKTLDEDLKKRRMDNNG